MNLLALRVKLLTLSVCTTGSVTLAATTTGYTRSTGSFLTDGFAVGMEILTSGFTTAANNGTGVITALSATVMTVSSYTVTAAASAAGYTLAARTLVTEAAAAARTLAVGLPVLRAWENNSFLPTTGSPFIEEDYLPGPVQQTTLGPLGDIEGFPMYVIKLYGVAGNGMSAPVKYADAIINLFPPRLALTLTSGDVLRVRTNPAPYRGQLMQADPGFAAITVTMPLRMRTTNSL